MRSKALLLFEFRVTTGTFVLKMLRVKCFVTFEGVILGEGFVADVAFIFLNF
jgi:hypothetical protein